MQNRRCFGRDLNWIYVTNFMRQSTHALITIFHSLYGHLRETASLDFISKTREQYRSVTDFQILCIVRYISFRMNLSDGSLKARVLLKEQRIGTDNATNHTGDLETHLAASRQPKGLIQVLL